MLSLAHCTVRFITVPFALNQCQSCWQQYAVPFVTIPARLSVYDDNGRTDAQLVSWHTYLAESVGASPGFWLEESASVRLAESITAVRLDLAARFRCTLLSACSLTLRVVTAASV